MNSTLRIYQGHDATNLEFTTEDSQKITEQLKQVGVRFEQWTVNPDLTPGTESDIVLAHYQTEINQLIREEGFQSHDVISLSADHPQKDELRKKFLSEHTHSEDEVRFFVAGEGLFTLHIDNHIYEVLCVAGDLISVPANTKHWFDMGPNPGFIALRFFNNPDGWVANFTGDDIANRFNRLEN